VHITERGDTEIGNIPKRLKRVGLERLRFDGRKVVDLAELSKIWVEPLSDGGFLLHAVEVPNSQLVDMQYDQRRLLTVDNGAIRVKTAAELQSDAIAGSKTLLNRQLKRNIKRAAGGYDKQLLSVFALVTICLYYARTSDNRLEPWIDDILADLQQAFPFSRLRDDIKVLAERMRTVLGSYYEGVDNISSSGG